MFRSFIFIFALTLVSASVYAQVATDTVLYLETAEVRALSVNARAPFTRQTLKTADIQTHHDARQLPYVLQNTPSVVAYSDAGTGIGQVNFRIRGASSSNTNVTVNSIPFNDAESQGVFIGNIPDIVSSAADIYIQRGVGSSTNGGIAFGSTINIRTNHFSNDFKAQLSSTYGSFNTMRHSFKIYSGLVAKHFAFDLRVSHMHSDGYVERAAGNYYAIYTSASYRGKRNNLTLNYFAGRTRNVQAWDGVDAQTIKANRRINTIGIRKNGLPPYNAKDWYDQHNFQLIYNDSLSAHVTLSNSSFLTLGNGFYDALKENRDPAAVLPSLASRQIGKINFIQEKWLDNSFFGNLLSVHIRHKTYLIVVGANASYYRGKHFGQIYSFESLVLGYTQYYGFVPPSTKLDANGFVKMEYNIARGLYAYGDVQIRVPRYTIQGDEKVPPFLQHIDSTRFRTHSNFVFANPKVGLSYQHKGYRGFLSYALAHREPTRDDIVKTSYPILKAERLHDIEFGNAWQGKSFDLNTTVYFMYYQNQIALAGSIDNVGGFLREQIGRSFRAGVEISAGVAVGPAVHVHTNLTVSRNHILSESGKIVGRLSFSPDVIGSVALSYAFGRGFELLLTSRYVSKQYLSNETNEALTLPGYFLQDASVGYRKTLPGALQTLHIRVLGTNVLNAQYSPNGYSFSTEAYYYPAAGAMISGQILLTFGKR